MNTQMMIKGKAVTNTLQTTVDLTQRTSFIRVEWKKSSRKSPRITVSASKRPTSSMRINQHHLVIYTTGWPRLTGMASQTSLTTKRPTRTTKMERLSSRTYTIQWIIIMRGSRDRPGQSTYLTSTILISSR